MFKKRINGMDYKTNLVDKDAGVVLPKLVRDRWYTTSDVTSMLQLYYKQERSYRSFQNRARALLEKLVVENKAEKTISNDRTKTAYYKFIG